MLSRFLVANIALAQKSKWPPFLSILETGKPLKAAALINLLTAGFY
jgi:hypothetical protein